MGRHFPPFARDKSGRDSADQLDLHDVAFGPPAVRQTQIASSLPPCAGLMAKTVRGEIIESPIIFELQGRPFGARIFQLDPRRPQGPRRTLRLKTANSGYLTRRLVDVAQDSIITIPDCGSDARASACGAIVDAGTVVATLAIRILGRTAAEDLKDADGKVIVSRRPNDRRGGYPGDQTRPASRK